MNENDPDKGSKRLADIAIFICLENARQPKTLMSETKFHLIALKNILKTIPS